MNSLEVSRDQAVAAVMEGRMSYRQAQLRFGVKKSSIESRIRVIRRQICPTEEFDKEKMIEGAIDSYRAKRMSTNMAAEAYGVPQATVYYRMHGRKPKRGRPTTFTAQEEEVIADIIVKCSRLNVCLNKFALRTLVQEVAKQKGISEAKFSRKWFKGFLKRHRNISQRAASIKSAKTVRSWNPETCEYYISLLTGLFMEGQLDDPDGLLNYDESSFKLNEGYQRVFAERGVKKAVSLCSGSETDRTQISVCMGGFASGRTIRPLVIYSGATHVESRFAGTEDDILFAVNETGNMDPAIMTEYAKLEIFPNLTCEKNTIFVDGHYSHVNNLSLLDAVDEFERESGKKVVIVCLPPGQTDKLQMCDVAVFGGVKRRWNDYLRGFTYQPGDDVLKNTFPRHLRRLLTQCHLDGSLKSGFEKTGIYPFNPDVLRATVPQTVIAPLETVPSVPEDGEMAKALKAVNVVVTAFSQCFHPSENEPPVPQDEPDHRLKPERGGMILTSSTYKERLKLRDIANKQKRAKRVLKTSKADTAVADVVEQKRCRRRTTRNNLAEAVAKADPPPTTRRKKSTGNTAGVTVLDQRAHATAATSSTTIKRCRQQRKAPIKSAKSPPSGRK